MSTDPNDCENLSDDPEIHVNLEEYKKVLNYGKEQLLLFQGQQHSSIDLSNKFNTYLETLEQCFTIYLPLNTAQQILENNYYEELTTARTISKNYNTWEQENEPERIKSLQDDCDNYIKHLEEELNKPDVTSFDNKGIMLTEKIKVINHLKKCLDVKVKPLEVFDAFYVKNKNFIESGRDHWTLNFCRAIGRKIIEGITLGGLLGWRTLGKTHGKVFSELVGKKLKSQSKFASDTTKESENFKTKFHTSINKIKDTKQEKNVSSAEVKNLLTKNDSKNNM